MVVDRRVRRVFQRMFLNTVLVAISLLMLVPIFVMISTSIKAPGESDVNRGLIPRRIEFGKFAEVFVEARVPTLARNSIIISVCTVALLLLLASLAAYSFARIDFALKEPFYFLFLAGLMIPGAAVILPLYQLNIGYGLMNTHAALIGPYVGLGIPFSVLLLRGFFEGLPDELEDAALIDGASRFTIYWRIMLPLTKPALVTVAIFQGLHAWNDFLLPMLFLTKWDVRTLPLGIIWYETLYITRHEHRFALIVMMTVPMRIVVMWSMTVPFMCQCWFSNCDSSTDC